MTCSEFDQFLYPYLDGEFDSGERLEVERHLASCADCARKLQHESGIHRAITHSARESVRDTRAPASLRARVEAGLRQEHSQRKSTLWVRAGAVAAMAASVGIAYTTWGPSPLESFVADAARRHARQLPFEVQSSAEGLEAWFQGKLDHRVPVPRFANSVPMGARLSNVKHKPAAYISYEAPTPQGARRLGLFVFHDNGEEVDASQEPFVEHSHGYNVAVWREGEIVYELVSDLGEADIRQLVRSQGTPVVQEPTPNVSVQPAAFRP